MIQTYLRIRSIKLPEHEINETRIAALDDKLARAEVIDVSKLSSGTNKFGATFTLVDEGTGERNIWQSLVSQR